ncbi:MAG: efflux RND transporter periplasmic adaptor subunit [Tannerella sp.]|jgi:RND family efflux transporter MFP subunit|nr:efflux RND transporter periplasmic adaptor subunit [Tannerella sp.]
MKLKTIFYVLAGVVLATACRNQPQGNANDIETPVSVQEVTKGSISKLINTTGTAQATNSVELNSEMTGYYNLQTNGRTGKPFKLGDAVQKGQLIIRLDNAEYVNGIALESKKLSLDIAEQEQGKQKELYEKGGVTLSEMRNTEVRVTNARYELENAHISLDKMNIRAPFNGIIVTLPHYTPGSSVPQGSSMVGVMDYSKMYVDINQPESNIGYVHANQSVYITHYTLPGDTLKGVISELSPAISAETRTFKGKILIDNNKLKIHPGMFVKADIVVDRADSAIIIPKNVILSNRNRKYVYIVEKNTAVIRNIITGLEDEDNIEVKEGLNESDNLIIRGYETLRENSRVKVLK